MSPEAPSPPGLIWRFFSRTLGWLLLSGALLFGAAGTFDWPQAWIYLGLTAVLTFGGGYWLFRHDPALLAERLGPVIQREQKGWDKVFMGVAMATWLGWPVLMGLDAVRYRWSEVPLAFHLLGVLLILVGSYIAYLTLKANSYASPVIKIQRERGHRVVTTGPYAYVRHPMYAGGVLFILGAPLLLGSWWGLALAVVFCILLGARAVLEERTLAAELDGYADYARRVHYRLVPYLW